MAGISAFIKETPENSLAPSTSCKARHVFLKSKTLTLLQIAFFHSLEMITLSEVRQRKTNITQYHLYVDSKKSDTNELIYKQEIDSLT